MSTTATAIGGLDWAHIGTRLGQDGYAVLPGLLNRAQARALARLPDTTCGAVGSSPLATVGFTLAPAASKRGGGDVLQFGQNLPEPLRTWHPDFYRHLADVANSWNELLEIDARYPSAIADFRTLNRRCGQRRAQSGLIRLREGDYQALHQHAEGEQVFPLQLIVLLSEPGEDFAGGEFVMTEQRPRMQSRPTVVPLRSGDAAIIATARRPVKGVNGYYRVNLKHAISRVHQGERISLEWLFHDAA